MGHYLSESGFSQAPERIYKNFFDAFQRYTSWALPSDAGAETTMRKFFREFDELKERVKSLEESNLKASLEDMDWNLSEN